MTDVDPATAPAEAFASVDEAWASLDVTHHAVEMTEAHLSEQYARRRAIIVWLSGTDETGKPRTRQADIARRLGVSPTAVWFIINGQPKRGPRKSAAPDSA